MKKTGPLVAGAAVAFASVIAAAPTASADVVNTDKDVTFTCTGNSVGEILNGLQPNTFTVTYPDEVAPGEIFTVSVQPGEMLNAPSEIGRMTFDYALPTTGTILETNIAGGASGLSGTAPSVIRVNATTKNSDANGTVARIWGASNSARYGQGSNVSNSTGGIHVPANTNFRLPKLDVVMRAPAQVGAEVTVGLPGADKTGFNAASTDFQWVRSRNNTAECSSGPDGAALTTTTVGNLAPVLMPTTTALAGGDRTLGRNQPTEFKAQVTPQYGTTALPQGDVEFWDTTNNVKLGEATPAANGEAKLPYTFVPPVDAGAPDQIVTVEARFLGVAGDIASSTSAPATVTNTGSPTAFNDVGFNLRAELGTESDTDVPVTIKAKIVTPTGTTPPAGAMVQLYRDGAKLGEPKPLPTTSEMEWTDTITRQAQRTTVKYYVEFVDAVIFDYTEWNGAAKNPVSVIVNGNLDLDNGGNGSLNIFGSLGDMFGS